MGLPCHVNFPFSFVLFYFSFDVSFMDLLEENFTVYLLVRILWWVYWIDGSLGK